MLAQVSSREESKKATLEQKAANKNYEVGSIDLRNYDNFFICHRNNEFAGRNNHSVYHSKKRSNKELEESKQVDIVAASKKLK